MRTNILLTLALIAAMMLAGCAKEESSEEPRKGNDMEQTLTKEQIVGVWRSGEYWVSFSESGYASAFLKLGDLEMIDDGDYRINGDTVFTMASPWLSFETPYAINSVTDTEISLTVTHMDVGAADTKRTDTVVLQKSTDIPCERNDGLAGKFVMFKGTWADGSQEEFTGRFDDNQYKTIRGAWPYIYLKPYLYIHFLIGKPMLIGELSNLENDTITYKAIR